MKLITLNIWGGKIFQPLINFLREHSKEIDIFCLQEVFNNPSDVKSVVQQEAKEDIYSDIKEILPQFDGYFAPTQDNEESLTIFIRKTISITKKGDIFVYRWRNAMVSNDASTYGINVQYIEFTQNNKKYTVCNLHGHWTPDSKGDNPARLEQSQNIRKFLNSIKGAKILCGDFNLLPDTQSMKILEEGMKNLVKEYRITSTRSHLYTKDIKFADYILVSPEIQVKDFKVLNDVVSDHLPLLLDFA